MECEKLAQEKTEMQRHYVMVSHNVIVSRYVMVHYVIVSYYDINHYVIELSQSLRHGKSIATS